MMGMETKNHMRCDGRGEGQPLLSIHLNEGEYILSETV